MSRVFPEKNAQPERPQSRVARDESKWQSQVFSPSRPDPVRRKALNKNDKDTATLFGKHKPDFENVSNKMTTL